MQFARWFGSTAVDGWRERDSARVRSHFEPNVAACLLAQPTLPLVSPARTLATEEVARRSYLTSAPKSRWPKGSGPLGPQLSSTPRHAVAPGQPVGAVGLQELVLRRKPARRRTPSRRATSCAFCRTRGHQRQRRHRARPRGAAKALTILDRHAVFQLASVADASQMAPHGVLFFGKGSSLGAIAPPSPSVAGNGAELAPRARMPGQQRLHPQHTANGPLTAAGGRARRGPQ